MKHKHYDLIIAWADGAEIQGRREGISGWTDLSHPDWHNEFWEYRIKPEEKKPVVRWLWAWEGASGWHHSPFKTEEEAAKEFGNETHFKLEWSRAEFPE